ncbi:MAG: hypothetical protein OEX22_09975 [Cyclobacteriaceae bacterium]|nr:hypothetical protein [Cyclobacteriaceae bacterium]
MKSFYILPLFVFLSISTLVCRGQKKAFVLPTDLKTEKVIFLEYEHIKNDVNMPYAQRKRNSHRNVISIEANKELALEATYYPFQYIISNRSEYYTLIKKGYKYVLENDMMNSYNYGENVDAGKNKLFSSTMYLKDLNTGKRYDLFMVTQDIVYEYGTIMKKFRKIIQKEFGIK